MPLAELRFVQRRPVSEGGEVDYEIVFRRDWNSDESNITRFSSSASKPRAAL